EHGAHAGGLAQADARHVGLDILHGVVDGQTGGHAAAGRVDVQLDVLVRVFRFQKQQLGNDIVGDVIVDGKPQKHDAFLEHLGIDVVGPLAAARIFIDRNRA